MKKLFAFVCILLLVACGDPKKDSGAGSNTQRFSGRDFLVLNQGTVLESTEQTLNGTMDIVSVEPLKSKQSNNSFSLEFSLKENGSLTLVANSDNKLENGMNIQFQRSGLPGNEKLTMYLANSDGVYSTKLLKFINPTKSIQVQIEVHNSEKPAHIIVSEGNHSVYNSLGKGRGNGNGNFWGLSFKNAIVNSAEQSEVQGHNHSHGHSDDEDDHDHNHGHDHHHDHDHSHDDHEHDEHGNCKHDHK